MSVISKQIDDLRDYAKSRNGELAKIINDAADTIESLSEKLSVRNMECSSAYYHGGWIPCSERLPTEEKTYIVTRDYGYGQYVDIDEWLIAKNGDSDWATLFHVVAWMEAPEPWKGETANVQKSD